MQPIAVTLLLGLAEAPPVELPITTVRVVERSPLISTSASSTRVARSFVDDREVIPGERQVGAELSYLTSDQGLQGRPLRFTDVVAMRLGGHASLGGRFDLGGRLGLLVKQPFFGGQSAFSGATLIGRFQVADRSALFLSAGGAPLAGQPGAALDLAVGWSRRFFIDPRDRYLAFATTAGAQGTALVAHAGQPPRILELVGDGALQFMLREVDVGFGMGFEVGTELAVPVWHAGHVFWLEDAPAFDARTRVHFYLGGFFTIGHRWDLLVRWAILDRGDAASPASRLPVLRGGYDQTELTFGFAYRFGPNLGDAL